jgi:hypothetical protein
VSNEVVELHGRRRRCCCCWCCHVLFCAAAIKVFLNDGDEEADFIMQVISAQDG